tara:strand:+ start:1230 stop:1487 length:258 start_codon:yes stop_codon:yes gene_type:complete
MKAINDFIVVDVDKVGPKNVGGFLLTEDLDEANRYIKAKIISAGDLAKGLEDGDMIYFDKYAGYGIDWLDNVYRVIRAKDVVLVE